MSTGDDSSGPFCPLNIFQVHCFIFAAHPGPTKEMGILALPLPLLVILTPLRELLLRTHQHNGSSS
jgi:hypothetical protein